MINFDFAEFFGWFKVSVRIFVSANKRINAYYKRFKYTAFLQELIDLKGRLPETNCTISRSASSVRRRGAKTTIGVSGNSMWFLKCFLSLTFSLR